MTLTVAQALQQIPVLSKAVVVAGSSGLDRPIRWTHIIDQVLAVSETIPQQIWRKSLYNRLRTLCNHTFYPPWRKHA